jgi:hypothetical protein
MLIGLVILLVFAIIAGGLGFAIHTLHWLLWIAIVVFILGVTYGFFSKLFVRGKDYGSSDKIVGKENDSE